MINTIRADFYRLFRSKGFFITQLALITTVIFSVASEAVGSINFQSNDPQLVNDSLNNLPWSATNALVTMSTMASFLFYFCLPLFVMTIGFDLTRKTYKTVLTAGVSRWHFFSSKYITFVVMSLMQFIFYYGLTFLTAWIKNGLGVVTEDFWWHFVQTFGIQFLCLTAIFGLATLAVYLTFSNVTAVLTVVLAPLILTAITIFTNVEWFIHFNFQSLVDSAWTLEIANHFWLKTTFSALATILLTVSFAYVNFQKKEL